MGVWSGQGVCVCICVYAHVGMSARGGAGQRRCMRAGAYVGAGICYMVHMAYAGVWMWAEVRGRCGVR